jgi:phosphopantothenoylcysteine synthetase/decarboxylase
MAKKYKFVVTAGSTREKIDDVRDWGNIFTGKTGLEISLALADVGDVLLLTSNGAHAAEFHGNTGKSGRIDCATFQRHADLLALLATAMRGPPPDAVLMTAAVTDYAPSGAFAIIASESIPGTNRQRWVVEDIQASKIKSTHQQVAFTGKPTLKLIDQFRSTWKYRGVLVKFKLEAGVTEPQLLEIARASRSASDANIIVANTLEMVQGPEPAAYIIGDGLTQRVPRAHLPAMLAQYISDQLK